MTNYLEQFKTRILKMESSDLFDFFLHLIILTSPIIIYGVSVLGFSLRLARIFTILIVPFLLHKLKKNPQIILRDKLLIYGIFPYLLFAALSILWTPANAVSFGLNRLGALYEVMFIYLIFIVADLNFVKFQNVIKSYLASAIIPLLICGWQITNNLIQFSLAEVPFSNLLIEGKYENLKNRTALMSLEGYSRILSSFAEPTIFGCFMSSILLVSFTVEYKNKLSIIFFRLFQLLVFICMVLSLSKLALLSFIVGTIIIFRKYKWKLLLSILGLSSFLIVIYLIVNHYGQTNYLSTRFTTNSGHFKLMLLTLNELKNINLFYGVGIGGIPLFSTNKFLFSRIYEHGLFGLLFATLVTILPFKVLIQKLNSLKFAIIKNACFGILFILLFEFHLYDNFIYTWPWILIGAITSFCLNSSDDIDSAQLS